MSKHCHVGVVIIGRNEGARLQKCLEATLGLSDFIVYVDSGSKDNSIEIAVEMGLKVIELDGSIPFTAGRARNEGVQILKELNSELVYIQFIDGDCELNPDWLNVALKNLDENKDVSIVCGQLKELYPNASIYNRICDIEWNGLTGIVQSCGGIFMVRLESFDKVNGFNPTIIAAEDNELCLRIRESGGKILRLSDSMAWHDANMLHFSQWWNRSVRCGHAYAEGSHRNYRNFNSYGVIESISVWFWSLILPLCIIYLLVFQSIWFILIAFVYPIKVWRIARWAGPLTNQKKDKWLYAITCIGAKWPELIGQFTFWLNYLRGLKTGIIEHK